MSYLKYLFIVTFLLLFNQLIFAQQNDVGYSVEGQAIVVPAGKLPFWFRANQYGSIPLAGTSGSLIGRVNKQYTDIIRHNFDWSGVAEIRANIGHQNYLTVIEGYLAARKGIFELKGGRFRDTSIIVDQTLSTGSFAVAGNALGIPQIKLAVPEYYRLPFFNQLFSVKASFSYGWIGDVPVYNEKNPLITNDTVRYLQNSLYLKIGKPDWRLKLYGAVNHHVMYGNEKRTFNLNLSPIGTFLYATVGKTYQGLSKVGNHIGSIDMVAEYDFDKVRLRIYRQNLFDVGALAHLSNITDGLNGLELINKEKINEKVHWGKILFELFYTKNQAGAYGTKTKSGDEDYYNNFEYIQGWTYYGLNLGNPLLSSRAYTRDGLPNDPRDFIIDNRVVALHAGFQGVINNIGLIAKLTYTKNYGTYGTSYPGHSTGGKYISPKFGLFGQVNQLSGYLEGNKQLRNNYQLGIAVGADAGGLYYNSAGVMLKLKKTFY